MTIPKEVQFVLEKLKKSGFEAYAVGGCVRDFLLARHSLSEGGLVKEPKDWDICTNARPEQIKKIFTKSFYENKFGTVTVQVKSKKPSLKEIQITTYRIDEKYTDKRHPDKVSFTGNLKEDLARRDFTINAMALDTETDNRGKDTKKIKNKSSKFQVPSYEIIDYFNGQDDLKNKIIRAVGNPDERFNEDALRMLRAIRLAVELGFKIEAKTLGAIQKNAGWIEAIAKERIRDELIKIIMSENPDQGIELLREVNLLKYVIPELEKGVDVGQNRHHIYTIYQHSILSLKYAAKRKYSLEVRLAALFHDIAKPQTKRGQGPESTFYNHDQLGARFSAVILERLKFPKKTIEKAANLVRNHMFVYGVDEVTEAAVRRLLRRVGPENIDDLINLRAADRLGSGVPKAVPYKLRHLQYVIEKVSKDPISVKMLKINGDDVMKVLGISPGPRIGLILNALLSEVLDEPKKNNEKYLKERTKELNNFSDNELKSKVKKIKEKKEEVDLEIKQKHWVK